MKKTIVFIAVTLSLFFILSTATLTTGVTVKSTPTPKPKTTPTAKPNTTNKNPSQLHRGGQTDLKPILDKLVKSKTITAAQETKIITYQNKKNAAQQAEMAKVRKMTDAQRKTYFEKQQNSNPNSRQRQNQFAELVKNKTITQKQSDAIDKAIAASRPNWRNRQNPPESNNGTTKK